MSDESKSTPKDIADQSMELELLTLKALEATITSDGNAERISALTTLLCALRNTHRGAGGAR